MWPRLSAAEIEDRLSSTPMWHLEKGLDDVPVLVREFVCKDFVSAVEFIKAAADIAELRGHHPDFHLTDYRNVKVVVCTHSLKALTDNDFNLCMNMDASIEINYSPKWLKDHPECVSRAPTLVYPAPSA